MEVIDITLRHLDLRSLRLGAEPAPADGRAPNPQHDPALSEEELVLEPEQEYTTAWQLPAEA